MPFSIADACDSHLHIMTRHFPWWRRPWRRNPRPRRALSRIRPRIGTTRAVDRPPSLYGTDNGPARLPRWPPSGAGAGHRGDRRATRLPISEAIGTGRGARHRFNEVQAGADHDGDDAAAGRADRRTGWHVQLHMKARELLAHEDLLACCLEVSLALDHAGRVGVTDFGEDPGWPSHSFTCSKGADLGESVRPLP